MADAPLQSALSESIEGVKWAQRGHIAAYFCQHPPSADIITFHCAGVVEAAEAVERLVAAPETAPVRWDTVHVTLKRATSLVRLRMQAMGRAMEAILANEHQTAAWGAHVRPMKRRRGRGVTKRRAGDEGRSTMAAFSEAVLATPPQMDIVLDAQDNPEDAATLVDEGAQVVEGSSSAPQPPPPPPPPSSRRLKIFPHIRVGGAPADQRDDTSSSDSGSDNDSDSDGSFSSWTESSMSSMSTVSDISDEVEFAPMAGDVE